MCDLFGDPIAISIITKHDDGRGDTSTHLLGTYYVPSMV